MQTQIPIKYVYSENMKYYIGIDGGGTKTAAIIQSTDGREAVVSLPGANNSDIGVDL